MPPEPPGPGAREFGEYSRMAGDILGRYERIAGAIERGMPLPDGMDSHAIALLIRDARQFGSGLHALAAQLGAREFRSGADAGALALARSEGRQEGAATAGRHRQPRRSRKPPEGQLTLLPGGKATIAAAAAGVVLIAGGAGAEHFSDVAARWSAAPAAHHARAFASLSPVRAAQVPVPQPYVPRHAKPSVFAATASPVPPAPAPSPSAPPPPPVSSPAGSPVNFDGYLDVQTAAVVTGPSGTGSLTFTAVGGAASWSASAPAGVTLSVSGGVLASGQPEVVTVTVAPGSPAGSGSIVLTDGDGRSQVVPVTWAAVPGLAV